MALNPLWDSTCTKLTQADVSHSEKFLFCSHFLVYFLASRNLIYNPISPDILFGSLQTRLFPDTKLLQF